MSRMCSSKSSGRSCLVVRRAMAGILPGRLARIDRGARRTVATARPRRNGRFAPRDRHRGRQQVPARRPRHWEADVLLRDGRTAHIRPIRPEDAELLVDFYARVSDQSKYYRFFSPMPNALRARRRALHPGRPRRPGGVRDDPVGADDRGRQLRRASSARARPRSPSSSRTSTRAAGSPSCCSSTSPRPAASAGSSGSSPRCCPTTSRMIQTFRDAGYRVASELRGRRAAASSSRSTRPTPRSA